MGNLILKITCFFVGHNWHTLEYQNKKVEEWCSRCDKEIKK